MRTCYYRADKTYKSNAWRTNGSVTIPDDVHFVRFYMDTAYAAQSNRDIGLNYPSTETAFVPYTGSAHPVSFPSAIYGGYVDVVTGEVWATYGEFVADGQNEPWGANEVSGKQRWSMQKSDIGDTKNNAKVICNWLEQSTSQEWGGWIGSTGNFLCFTPLGEFANVDAWKAYLAEHNLQIVYELASPVLITTLTPQQITAIVGDNTIWSDADGSMTATYLKKG